MELGVFYYYTVKPVLLATSLYWPPDHSGHFENSPTFFHYFYPVYIGHLYIMASGQKILAQYDFSPVYIGQFEKNFENFLKKMAILRKKWPFLNKKVDIIDYSDHLYMIVNFYISGHFWMEKCPVLNKKVSFFEWNMAIFE